MLDESTAHLREIVNEATQLLSAYFKQPVNSGHLPKFCEASTHLLSHLKKIWPDSRYIDVFPVFRNLM